MRAVQVLLKEPPATKQIQSYIDEWEKGTWAEQATTKGHRQGYVKRFRQIDALPLEIEDRVRLAHCYHACAIVAFRKFLMLRWSAIVGLLIQIVIVQPYINIYVTHNTEFWHWWPIVGFFLGIGLTLISCAIVYFLVVLVCHLNPQYDQECNAAAKLIKQAYRQSPDRFQSDLYQLIALDERVNLVMRVTLKSRLDKLFAA